MKLTCFLGFPCGSTGKESTCNAGDLGSTPGLGRSPGEAKGYPLQYSGLENSMDYIVHGVTKSWTRLSNFHFQEALGQFCHNIKILKEVSHLMLRSDNENSGLTSGLSGLYAIMSTNIWKHVRIPDVKKKFFTLKIIIFSQNNNYFIFSNIVSSAYALYIVSVVQLYSYITYEKHI